MTATCLKTLACLSKGMLSVEIMIKQILCCVAADYHGCNKITIRLKYIALTMAHTVLHKINTQSGTMFCSHTEFLT